MAGRRGPGHIPLSQPPPEAAAEPDLIPAHKAAVLTAIRWAWSQLRSQHRDILIHRREEEITAALEHALNLSINDERQARWLADFQAVTRGSKVITSDGRLEKQPDLHFRPPRYRSVVQESDWDWVIECKVIDGPGSVEKYCVEGVRRFSSGEYAARMRSGAMLGYVRDGQTPFISLDPRLKNRFGTRDHRPASGHDHSRSEHDRSTLTPRCVDIEIDHLWLPADE